MHENKVELIGTYGGDETHSLSAWTSTSRDLTDEKRNRIDKLLKALAENGHGTPFEKSYLHFLVTVDTVSHYQILKHRIGTSCVTGDTEIHMPIPANKKSGNSSMRTRTIKQLYEECTFGIDSISSTGKKYKRKYGRKVPVRTKNDDGSIGKSYINNVFYNGKKEVFEFITETGKKIKATADHKFYSSNREWEEIQHLLGLKVINSVAMFSNNDCYIATNGIEFDDPERPWTFKSFFEPYENISTRIEMANITNLDYNLIKKWGYIHNIKFAEDTNKDFKKGNIPWNKNVYGYKAPREKRGINPNINKDLSYKIWRATVGNWTRQQLPILLKKYNYVCQAQLGICSRNFVSHHIIPVSVSKDLATEIENLILVCVDCHKLIHKNRKSEIDFAEKIKNIPVKNIFEMGKKPSKRKILSVDFEKIVKVNYVGIEDVYDLEVENTHNYVANGFIVHNCNTESGRYKELKDDKFYIPIDWDQDEQMQLIKHSEESIKKYHECLARLMTKGVSRKRAKESARFYLPLNNQLVMDISFNFRSFINFQNLRNDDNAQVEIRDIAKKMLIQIYENGSFKHSLEAFGWTKEKIYA